MNLLWNPLMWTFNVNYFMRTKASNEWVWQGEVVLVEYDTRLQSTPFIFFKHVTTLDVSYFYPWQVDHPHQSGLKLWIPCFDNMVYVDYCLFSSCQILTRIREVLWSLGSGMGHYLYIAQKALKVLVRVPMSCLIQLFKCPRCVEFL